MPTVIAPNAYLRRPSQRVLLEIWEGTTGSIVLPATIGRGPHLVSTDDVYPSGLLRRARRMYSDEVMADEPLGWWRLRERVVTDAVLNQGSITDGLDMIFQPPGVTLGELGPIVGESNLAVRFDGVSSGAVVMTDLLTLGDAFTIEAWVRSSAVPDPGESFTIFAGVQAGGPALVIDELGHLRALAIDVGDVATTTSVVNNAAWHHVVWTKDGADNLLFLDGREVTSTVTNQTIVGGGLAIWAIGYQCNARIADVAVYGRRLSPERVAAHARAGSLHVARLCERRLVTDPVIAFADSDIAASGTQARQISFALSNHDGRYTETFVQGDPNGILVVAHLYDVNTDELTQNVLVARIDSCAADLFTVQATATEVDDILEQPVPRSLITTATVHTLPLGAPAGMPPTLALGVCDHVPGYLVKTRTFDTDPDEYDYAFCLNNVGIQRLYVGDSVLGIGGDGVALQLDESIRGEFQVLPRTYRIDGRYMTVVRFGRPSQDSSGPIPVTADVHAVFPPMTDDVIEEWKWGGNWRGSLGVSDARAGSEGGVASGISLADLVSGPVGEGLGAVRFNGTDGYLDFNHPEAMRALRGLMLEMWVRADPAWNGIGGSATPILTGPHFDRDAWISSGGLIARAKSWALLWNPGADSVTFTSCTSRGNPTVTSPNGSMTNGAWHHVGVALELSGATFRLALYIDGVLASYAVPASDFTGAMIEYASQVDRGLRFGLAPSASAGRFFLGDLAFLRLAVAWRSDDYWRQSYALMRRNPAASYRTLLRDEAGDQVNEAALLLLQDDFDAIEDGAIKVDGGLQRQATLREVLPQLDVLRGCRRWRDANGATVVAVARPATYRYAEEVARDHPVAWWRLSRDPLVSFAEPDRSGNGFVGQTSAVGTMSTLGDTNDGDFCVILGASPGFFILQAGQCGGMVDFLDGQGSIEFWIASNPPPVAPQRPIISKSDNARNHGWVVWIDDQGVIGFRASSGVNIANVTGGSIGTVGLRHVVITMRAGVVRGYVDGVLVSLTTVRYVPDPYLAGRGVTIGAYADATGPVLTDCAIDDFALYETELAADRVAAHYAAAVNGGSLRIDGQFDVDGVRGNIVAVRRWAGPSAQEAIAVLPVAYRQVRDATGAIQGLAGSIEYPIMARGRTADPLQLPLVRDGTTADVVGWFYSQQLIAQAKLLELTLGHEARRLLSGQVARLQIGSLGIDGEDFLVVTHARGEAHEVGLVRYSEDPFIYQLPNYATNVLALSPTAFYRLGERVVDFIGTAAVDVSPHGHDATYAGDGALYLGWPGALGGGDNDTAVGFDGYTSYVDVPAAAAPIGAGPFTWAGWVRCRMPPPVGQSYLLASRYVSANDYVAIYLRSDGQVAFELFDGTTTLAGVAGNVCDGAWHFIVAACANNGNVEGCLLVVDGGAEAVLGGGESGGGY